MQCNRVFLQAFEQVYNERFDEYISAFETDEPHVFSKKHEKRMAKLIKRQRKPYFNLICTAGRRAACIIVAVIIFSAAALSVKAVRETLSRLISNTFPDHIVLEADNDTDSSYPDKIENEYSLANLPEGFVRTEVFRSENSIETVYMNGDQQLSFSQYTKEDFKIYIDKEHCVFEQIYDPDGMIYKVVSDNDGVMIIWDNGKYVFEVSGNLDKNKILDLCKSIKIEK